MRRALLMLLVLIPLTAAPAAAVTVRDIIELSQAGLSDEVLLALIEVDRPVFSLDSATLKSLKQAGVSEPVILAMIRSGRTPPPAVLEAPPAPAPGPVAAPTDPQVIVIDHHEPSVREVPVPVPVAMPVYVPLGLPQFGNLFRNGVITTTIPVEGGGAVRARVPVPANCIKAQPVFWGFGGKLRPGSWQPPPTVVCQ